MLKELLKEHLTDEIAKVFFYEGDELLGQSGRLVDLEPEYRETPDIPEALSDVRFKVIDTEGGGEGDGEYQHTVVKFTMNQMDTLVIFTGWYYSYSGSDYNKWSFAKAIPAIAYVSE